MGNRHPTIVPYESFETADGDLVIAGGNDDIWRRLCGALDLAATSRTTRAFGRTRIASANHDELRPLLDRVLKTRARAPSGSNDWQKSVSRADRFERSAKCSPIRKSSLAT